MKNAQYGLISINFNAIYAYNYEEKNSKFVLNIFYYDENSNNKTIKYVNKQRRTYYSHYNKSSELIKENGIVYFTMNKNNNLCLKVLTVDSNVRTNRSSLKNIYLTLINKIPNKSVYSAYNSKISYSNY